MCSKTKIGNILLIVGLLLLFGAGFLVGRKTAHPEPPIPQVDTITIRDTIVDYKPQEAAIPVGFKLIAVSQIEDYEKTIEMFRDSINAKPTLVTIHDTTFIAVPITEKTFTDNKTYECAVTGYDTKMIWHKSFQETKIITETYPAPPKWMLSPYAGATFAPGILSASAGIKADFWCDRWQFTPSLGYSASFTGHGYQHGVMAGFSASYNLIRR